MEKELIIKCSENQYDLYNLMSQYFYVEKLGTQDNSMGLLDGLKILIDPISKSIETLGNVIVAFINSHSCTISVKNGEKEAHFEGPTGKLKNEDVISLLNKVFEE